MNTGPKTKREVIKHLREWVDDISPEPSDRQLLELGRELFRLRQHLLPTASESGRAGGKAVQASRTRETRCEVSRKAAETMRHRRQPRLREALNMLGPGEAVRVIDFAARGGVTYATALKFLEATVVAENRGAILRGGRGRNHATTVTVTF